MELKQAIEKRTSIRSYTEESVRIEDLKEMVRRAGCAPSVNNYQPWKFYVITNKELMNQMAEVIDEKIINTPSGNSKVSSQVKKQVAFYATFFKDAPAVIAVTMDDYESVFERGVDLEHDQINKMRSFPDMQSAGAAIQNLLLTAVDLGYGACWMSAPLIAKTEIEKMLRIEKPLNLVAFVAVGKAVNPDKTAKPKKSLSEILEIIE